jgi:hypothetical protein
MITLIQLSDLRLWRPSPILACSSEAIKLALSHWTLQFVLLKSCDRWYVSGTCSFSLGCGWPDFLIIHQVVCPLRLSQYVSPASDSSRHRSYVGVVTSFSHGPGLNLPPPRAAPLVRVVSPPSLQAPKLFSPSDFRSSLELVPIRSSGSSGL